MEMDEIKRIRMEKRDALKALGQDPYGGGF